MNEEESTARQNERLFSPKGIWFWTLLLTPVFGEWCIYRNYKILGLQGRIRRSRFCLLLIGIFYTFCLVCLSDAVCRLNLFLLFLVWTFSEWLSYKNLFARSDSHCGKRSWWKAVPIAFFLLFIYYVLIAAACLYFQWQDRILYPGE